MTLDLEDAIDNQSVLDAGLLIGILRRRSDGSLEINREWFGKLPGNLAEIPRERRDELFKLIDSIYPESNTTKGWYSIREPLFLVRTKGRRDGSLVGLGCQRIFTGARSSDEAKISIFLPLIDLEDNRFAAEGPFEIKAALSFGPVREIVAKLRFSANDTFALSFVVHRDGKDEEVTLSEIIGNPGGHAELLIDLLLDQVKVKYPTIGVALSSLKDLLSVNHYGILEGKSFFVDLARQPAGDVDLLKTWLNSLAVVLSGNSTQRVRGAGIENDPYILPLFSLGGGAGFDLTFARNDGRLLLGMKLTTNALRLAQGVGVALSVKLALVSFRSTDLEPDYAKPSFELALSLTNPASSIFHQEPLFSYFPMHWVEGAPKEALFIGSVSMGMRSGLQPFVELNDVHQGQNAESGQRIDVLAGGEKTQALLENFACALKVRYESSRAGQLEESPRAEMDLGELIEDAFALSSYRSAFARFAKVAGSKGTNLESVTGSLRSLAAWIGGGGNPDRALDWLKDRFNNNLFESVGDLLSLCSDRFGSESGSLIFRATADASFLLGGTRSTGMQLRLKAGYSLDAVKFAVNTGVRIPFPGEAGSPGLSVKATMSLGESAKWALEKSGLRLNPSLQMQIENDTPSCLIVLPFPPDEDFRACLEESVKLQRGSSTASAEAWFLALGARMLEDVLVGNRRVQDALRTQIAGVELGKVLKELGVLKENDQHQYRLGSLRSLDATEVLSALLASAQGNPPADGDGVWLIKRRNENVSVFIRQSLRMEGMTLHLGRWLTKEDGNQNWLTRSGTEGKSPGAELVLLAKRDGKLTFQPGIELTSVGFDIENAKKDGPLFSVSGVVLEGVKARSYLALGGGARAEMGCAIELNEFSMPLGPKLDGGAAGSNPVAANLLGSGDAAGTAKSKETSQNPAFSATVAYSKKFSGKIIGGIPSADGTTWVPLNRSFGPMRVRQLGLGFSDGGELKVGYDGSVSLSSLQIELDHLAVSIPLKDPSNAGAYSLELAGLNFSLASGPIQVTGGLLKAGGGTDLIRYDGTALIKAQNFTISGFGSYAMAAGAPSMFIYAALYKDMGGPAWFHVTGLAAGFGYNRALRLPTIERVHEFPLVRAALDESAIQGSGQQSVSNALEMLRAYIPPSRGDYWLAIGVRFTSFEMIQSFALLSVSFGHEIEIGLLGMSTMTLPKQPPKKDGDQTPAVIVAYVEMALRAVIRPADGLIAVEGRLTDNSYILDKNCKLTGGFAFYTWFSGEHTGDFVVTLGGYHPRFKRPEHYPLVPRLAIHWRVNDNLTISGEEYFAMTPSCLMVGGKLCAIYKSGAIEAWFTAYAHMLLNWQPFYYAIEMGISIGVACRVRINLLFTSFTLSLRVELSVDLALFGPPFSGVVRVDLSVISFTIRFGGDPQPLLPLQGKDFVEAFLPAKAVDPSPLLKSGAQANPLITPDVITIQIASGLIAERIIAEGQPPLRIVNALGFALTAQSLIPSMKFDCLGRNEEAEDSMKELCGIRPMGKKSLETELRIVIRYNGEEIQLGDENNYLDYRLVGTGVPEALWGCATEEGKVEAVAEPKASTIQANVGVRVFSEVLDPEGSLPPIAIQRLAFEDFEAKVSWRSIGEADSHPAPEPGQTLADTIFPEGGHRERDAILAALRAYASVPLNSSPDLRRLQEKARSHSYFQAEPQFRAVGESWK
jgi:hypothetical protein